MAPRTKKENPASSLPPMPRRVTRSTAAANRVPSLPIALDLVSLPGLTKRSKATGRAPRPVVPEEPPAKKSKPDPEKKKGNASDDDDNSKVNTSDDGAGEAPAPPASKTVVIEACKQCNSFKTRALKVKEGLENAFPDITVEINPEKPRRGCFEIRDSTDQIFLSLLDMKRPFTPMKNLDMDEVIQDIVQELQSSEDVSQVASH